MIYSVQYLRALAALLVVISHSLHKVGQLSAEPVSYLTIGGAGVDLFFIISGFVMCHATADKNIQPGLFMRARMVRILPLYWLLSCAALLVFIVKPDMVNSSGGVTTLLHPFTLYPVGEKLLIQNGWTLSYEFWFYLIFTLGLLTRRVWRPVIVTVVIIGLVGLGYAFTPHNPTLSFATSPLLLEFLMGVFAYSVLKRHLLSSRASLVMLAVGLAGLAAANSHPLYMSRVLMWGLAMKLVFIGFVALEVQIKQLANKRCARLFKALGDSSYSLCLSHPFAISALALMLKKTGLEHQTLLCLMAFVAASLVAGHLCYVLLEKPLLNRLRTHVHSKPALSGLPLHGKSDI